MTMRLASLLLALCLSACGDEGSSVDPADSGPTIDVIRIDAVPQPDAPGAPVEVSCSAVTPTMTITTTGFSFSPSGGDVTINVGDIIEFAPLNEHDVTAGRPGNTTGWFSVGGGATGCYRFDDTGGYDYFCSVHPAQMQATITVAE